MGPGFGVLGLQSCVVLLFGDVGSRFWVDV